MGFENDGDFCKNNYDEKCGARSNNDGENGGDNCYNDGDEWNHFEHFLKQSRINFNIRQVIK